MQMFEPQALRLVDPVVDRWVQQPPWRVEEVLGDASRLPVATAISLGDGELQLDGRFEASAESDGRVVWKAPGRLLLRGASVVRFARVEVEVVVWSDELSEVTVRSCARRLVTWGERRERRYFSLAHEAATHVARLLSTPDIGAPNVNGSRAA
jgi:hypothetical protein